MYKKEEQPNEIFNEKYISKMQNKFEPMIKIVSETVTPHREQFMLIGTPKNQFGLAVNKLGEVLKIRSKHEPMTILEDVFLPFIFPYINEKNHSSYNVDDEYVSDYEVNYISHLPNSRSSLKDRINFEDLLKDMAIENGLLDPTDASISNGCGFYDETNLSQNNTKNDLRINIGKIAEKLIQDPDFMIGKN